MNYLPQIISVHLDPAKRAFGSIIGQEWVLHYMVAGTCMFQIEECHYEVTQGDMLLIPPNMPRMFSVHFVLPEAWVRKGYPHALTLPPEPRKKVEHLYRKAKQELRSKNAYRQTVANGLLTGLIGIYLENTNLARKGNVPAVPVSGNNIEKAISFIHQNYRKSDLSLKEISVSARLTVNYFCRIFKTITGDSAMHYLNCVRIRKSEELLLNSELNCSEIAQEVGYSGIHTFSRLFKRIKGVPPTEFKRIHV